MFCAGDALEIIATFSTTGSASSFGLSLRQSANFSCAVGYSPTRRSIEPLGWSADIVPQPVANTVELHVFLDRSVVETYTGGAVATSRCMLPAGGGGDDAKGVVRSHTTPLVLLEPLFRCLWSLPKSFEMRGCGQGLWAVGGDAKLLKLEAWPMASMWRPVT